MAVFLAGFQSSPEVSIPGAVQKDRGLWGRDWARGARQLACACNCYAMPQALPAGGLFKFVTRPTDPQAATFLIERKTKNLETLVSRYQTVFDKGGLRCTLNTFSHNYLNAASFLKEPGNGKRI